MNTKKMTQDLAQLKNLILDREKELVSAKRKEIASGILSQAGKAFKKKKLKAEEKEIWFSFLNTTGKNDFLKELGTTESRNIWAELVFLIIQQTGYSLLDLFNHRVEDNKTGILFQDMSGSAISQFTYEQIQRSVREIAAVFYERVPIEPRVAIFCENSIESASCDLACLFYDIYNTPLNAHFSKDTLSSIFKQVGINIVVTDTMQRLELLEKIRKSTGFSFSIFVTDSNIRLKGKNDFFLGEKSKELSEKKISVTLSSRKRRSIDAVASTMFTSGSTGIPKGVSFSIYNLVSKRFARAAALPEIGKDEVMLCYLPLYHTFGRYLEMLGTIYWGGKYVLVGNPSKETLLALFPKINPSIFISIPLRWSQLHEEASDLCGTEQDTDKIKKILRKVVGKRLKWGLSAAGYLDPKTFRFFQDHGVSLCSGFGMTEATGGITMTPPGKYFDDSTGIPLPGVYTRTTKAGELEISGHYIAHYLEDAPPDGHIPFPGQTKKEFFLSTGDIFKISDNGHYSIVDRVKDIYKNNKGQTIAPRTVEMKFTGVPGIQNTFLVGDAKPYNVLLIVPDNNDPVLAALSDMENRNEYFHQIITAANKDLSPYERVINFAVLERSFELEKGELTPKGSFNRKAIVKNFQDEIKNLYRSNFVLLKDKDLKVSIPRWFFRDLGILENDIVLTRKGLQNKVTKLVLPLKKEVDGLYLIGDLKYNVRTDVIDLGLFARQPRLWIGNPCLIEFSPCKEGWDLPLENVSAQVFLPGKTVRKYEHNKFPGLNFVRDQKINLINNLMCCSMFSDSKTALSCTRQIGKVFSDYDERIAVVIRRRLEALSSHKDEEVRAQAYLNLIIHDPHHDYSKLFPTFIQSGLSFLTEKSIKEIAGKEIGRQKLESLRQRLYSYREQLSWPSEGSTQKQFQNLLSLLYHFAMENLDYYIPIRAELASWILHKSDPVLAHVAKKYFIKLNQFFEEVSIQKYKVIEESEWDDKLLFDPGIIKREIKEIKNTLIGTIFLQQSVKLAYDEDNFELGLIPNHEIWVTKLPSSFHYRKYRLSINTTAGRHYDLCLMLNEKLKKAYGMETIYLWASIAGYPFGSHSLPNLGCSQPDMGAMSVKYMSELTAWDKIREYAGLHYSLGYLNKSNAWEKLIIKAIKVFFTVWKQSDYQIVPGHVAPENVVVPELDYLETATVQSLAGWEKYESPLSLINPIIKNFYNKTISHYPWCKKQLDVKWIFDACTEALGSKKSGEFIKELSDILKTDPIYYCDGLDLRPGLKEYISWSNKNYYLPIALFNAIDQFREWENLNPDATASAREQTMFELNSLFKLYRYPEIVRYHYYRNTYFGNGDLKIRKAFDKLLKRINKDISIPAFHHPELSSLQSTLTQEDDRLIFSRMVFSRMQSYQKIDLVKIGEDKKEQIVVTTELTDKQGTNYTIREPLDPSEIGQLYRLFFEENYPKTISEMDKHIVVLDRQKRVIGGLCYIPLENNIVLLDGAAVTTSLKGRGIGSAMIEDFSARMAELDVKVIKAHFLHGSFYLKLKFKVDKKWGALVKFL